MVKKKQQKTIKKYVQLPYAPSEEDIVDILTKNKAILWKFKKSWRAKGADAKEKVQTHYPLK